MCNLFVGKFKNGDQLEKNYYHYPTTDEKIRDQHFSGLRQGDYVLPIKNATIEKLFRFDEFQPNEDSFDAKFTVVHSYEPPLLLTSHITNCQFFQPDMNLLNKAVRPTKNLGFIPIALKPDSPDVPEIDFYNAVRKFYVCIAEKQNRRSFFKPFDICVVVSNTQSRSIIDIVEFTGQAFVRNDVLWTLYLEKTNHGEEQYSLQELLHFAAESEDNAPKKHKYLTALLEELESEGIFAADSAIALYDNVIVGRKQSAPIKTPSSSKPKDGEPDDIEDDDGLEDLTNYGQYAKLMAFNPNIILYGPPGTGKTYGAMRIIEAFETQNGQSCTFKQVIAQGRARFITFHQAFSYEEFVEGIRPELDEDKNMVYPVKPGVLTEIADACRIQAKKSGAYADALSHTSDSSEVWRVSLGGRNEDSIFTTLRNKSVIATGHGPDEDIRQRDVQNLPSALRALYERISIGDIVMVFNSARTIRLLGVVTEDYFYSNEDSFGYPHRRKVQWLKSFEQAPKDIYELNQKKNMMQGSIHKLNVSIADAISLLSTPEDTKVATQPYYLIIDEINRGNIAKIFGELITLIEKDKREHLSCTLPYSHKPFTMPKNLYLIGTMNTSDRSVALLDTALRRRFAFIEINPDSSIVERTHPTIGGNVSPAKLLQELNNRITKAIDRDHRIGHSYFLGDDLVTKYDLYNVWYYKALPLLMEYFYNDVKQVNELTKKAFFDLTTGETILFSLKSGENGISEFEAALMKVYEREE